MVGQLPVGEVQAMITVLCGHCEVQRHAPCSSVCRIESSSVAIETRIVDGPQLVIGRDFEVGERA